MSLLFFVYRHFNPEPCPNESSRRIYGMQFEGYVTGYYVDCARNNSVVCFKADTVQLQYYDLYVEKYNLTLGGEYFCLYYEIDVNDRIIKLKNSYKIILIKPNEKLFEYNPDCFTKHCSCKSREKIPSDFKKYNSI